MKTNKIITLFIICLIFAFTLCLSSCGSSGENNEHQSDEKSIYGVTTIEDETTIEFEKSELTLFVGDEKYLNASYVVKTGVEISYMSSKPEIASVTKDGKVIAKKIGTTEITVKYGTASDVCKVEVLKDDVLPVLESEYMLDKEMQVYLGDVVNFKSYLMYKGKKAEDATIEYKSSDTAVGTVEDGVFTPVKKGTTIVTVKASWKDFDSFTMQNEYIVTVKDFVDFYVNGGITSFSLHNRAKYGYTDTEFELEVFAAQDGTPLNYNVEIVSGTDVVTLEGNTVKAIVKKSGNAVLKVSCTDLDGNGLKIFLNVTVYDSAPSHQEYVGDDGVTYYDDCGLFNDSWLDGDSEVIEGNENT